MSNYLNSLAQCIGAWILAGSCLAAAPPPEAAPASPEERSTTALIESYRAENPQAYRLKPAMAHKPKVQKFLQSAHTTSKPDASELLTSMPAGKNKQDR